nr:ADP-ribosylation factor-like protein 6-interacting protein 4 isoform X2 [Peromyscus maniculatus bairdii]
MLKTPVIFSPSELSVWWNGRTRSIMRENSRRVAFSWPRTTISHPRRGARPIPPFCWKWACQKRNPGTGTKGSNGLKLHPDGLPGRTHPGSGPEKSNWRLFSHAGACWRLVVDVGTGRPRDPSRGSRAALLQLRKAELFSRGAESTRFAMAHVGSRKRSRSRSRSRGRRGSEKRSKKSNKEASRNCSASKSQGHKASSTSGAEVLPALHHPHPPVTVGRSEGSPRIGRGRRRRNGRRS